MFPRHVVLLCLVLLPLHSALYQIGEYQATYYDSIRDRSVQTTVFYPKNNSTHIRFPPICFAHGFSIEAAKYRWFATALVPYGYVVALLDAIGVQDIDFELDQIFILYALKQQSLHNASSAVYQLIDTNLSIAAGHSLGGGTSFVVSDASFVTAHGYNSSYFITHAVTLSLGDYTIPPVHDYASNVQIPLLMYSATQDCIDPPANNSELDYTLSTSQCKVYFEIVGGCHCYFAGLDYQCDAAQSKCGAQPSVSRPQQQNITAVYMLPWLEYQTKNKTEEKWNEYLMLLSEAVNESVITEPWMNVSGC